MLSLLSRLKTFPYVAAAAVALVTTVSLWSYGKGFNAAEKQWQKTINKALEDQYNRMVAINAKDQQLILEKMERRNETRDRVAKVIRLSCPISPECLQWYDDVIRQANKSQ